MKSRYLPRVVRWIVIVLPLGVLPASLPAGDLADLEISLKLAPRDAAFFGSSMRLGEQVDIAAHSKAWATLKAMPSVRDALEMYEEKASQEGTPAAKFKKALEHPTVKDLLGLLGDMFSRDTFCLGDENYPEVIELLQKINYAVQYGPMLAELTGESGRRSREELTGSMLLTTLADNLEAIKIPTTIAGFKVSDKERAKKNLENLAGLITVGCMTVPQLNEAFQRTDIAGHEFLVLSLSGEMIPWEELPMEKFKKFETEPGEAEKIADKLKHLTLVIAIGLSDDYLLFSIGESTDCLARLGKGALLIDRAELEPLKKFSDRRLASISYVSAEMATRQSVINQENVDQLSELVEGILPHTGLPDHEQNQIRRDTATVVADLRHLLPKPGAMLAFSFLTHEGVEGYSYHWSENICLDGSKPLTLLENVGGNPLLAAVWRTKYEPNNYEIFTRWCVLGYHYFDRFAVPEMSRKDREKFQQFADLVSDVPDQLDYANRQMLLPALADGQGAIVLDGKTKVRRFCKAVDLGKPMPILEPALVVGVSDAELLRQACAEYREAFETVVDALRTVEPEEIPPFELPKAKVKKTAHGTIYSYPLPKEWKVDKKIVPSVGLSDSVAVLAITQDEAERLLTATGLSIGGVLSGSTRPVAAACLFDFAGFVDTATPWVELAAEKIMVEKLDLSDDAPEADKAKARSIMEEVHTVLKVLKAVRTITAESHLEDGVWVTHSLVEVRDID